MNIPKIYSQNKLILFIFYFNMLLIKLIINPINKLTMLTLLGLIVVGLLLAVAIAVIFGDGEDHSSEMEEYEKKHPYSSREERRPYDP